MTFSSLILLLKCVWPMKKTTYFFFFMFLIKCFKFYFVFYNVILNLQRFDGKTRHYSYILDNNLYNKENKLRVHCDYSAL